MFVYPVRKIPTSPSRFTVFRQLCSKTALEPVSLYSQELPGEKTLPPIIILHGMLGQSQNWTALGRAMSRKLSRTVIIPDARNHGKSPHSPEISYYHMASDIMELMTFKNLDKATIIGHSMGARTAMTLALTEPSVIKELMLVDATPVHPTTAKGIEEMKKFIAALEACDLREVPIHFTVGEARKFVNDQLLPFIPKECMRQWLLMNLVFKEDEGVFQWQFNLPALKANFTKHLTFVPVDCQSNVFAGRTLFIGGEKSTYIPKDSHGEIQKIFPSARFVYVPNAGHWVQVDSPKRFLQEVFEFIGK